MDDRFSIVPYRIATDEHTYNMNQKPIMESYRDSR